MFEQLFVFINDASFVVCNGKHVAKDGAGVLAPERFLERVVAYVLLMVNHDGKLFAKSDVVIFCQSW